MKILFESLESKKMHNRSQWLVGLLIAFAMASGIAGNTAFAADNSLQSIDYSLLPGNKLQIQLGFSAPVGFAPGSFTIERPARIAVDLPNVDLALEKKSINVDSGVVRNIRAVEASDRSRVVLTLTSLTPYELRSESNYIYINFDGAAAVAARGAVASALGVANENILKDVDFRRGTSGEGRITIALTDPSTIVNIEEKGTKILVDFVNATFPENLVRRLDVTDFATPVSVIDAYNSGPNARIAISTTGSYEHLAYQAGGEFTVAVRPLTEEEAQKAKQDEFGYSGEKLSLNFQNIEVRAVLQLIADFTGLNVVASDTVQGNITLRLKNVPWDQALDIILKTRGLGMRQTGNVVLIAPNDELAEREKKELEAQKQRVELAPLQTEFYQINYAKASDIAALLKSDKTSILTERGNVSIDARTNTLMVLESAEKQEDISRLIKKLDVAIRQVMIESRIVVASDDFSRDLGVRTGVTAAGTYDSNNFVGTTGSTTGTDTMVNSAITNTNATGNPLPVSTPALGDRYNVNLPAGASAGRIALAILGADYLVDLELSALQSEGRGEVLSNPRVITSNQKQAVIEQGVEIPYQEASSSGATAVSFKKAVLSLSVTPQITPDDRVVMDLEVSKDSVGGIYGGVPSINTRSVNTQVLVDNGDTVVLGGIYEESSSEGETKVPLLGDIPLLGYLFKSKSKKENKSELLIFVTPKILKDSLNNGI